MTYYINYTIVIKNNKFQKNMSDFNKYATKHLGLNEKMVNSYQELQSMAPNVSSSVTPTIIEERQLNIA